MNEREGVSDRGDVCTCHEHPHDPIVVELAADESREVRPGAAKLVRLEARREPDDERTKGIHRGSCHQTRFSQMRP